MSKVIHGVPESITRDQYLGLIEGVGLDPALVRSLTFRPDGVHAELFTAGDDGQPTPMEDRLTHELICHTVYIPVV